MSSPWVWGGGLAVGGGTARGKEREVHLQYTQYSWLLLLDTLFHAFRGVNFL